MLKKTSYVALTCAFVLSGCASNGQEKTDDVTRWTMTHISDESHPWHETSEVFAELVEEKTDGEVVIDIYPNSQLGDEVDSINSIKYGATDVTITGETLEVWTPNAILMATPYAFEDQEHKQKIIEGEIGQEIEQDIIDDVGLTPLFYMDRSPRNLTSNIPISHPDDLNGFNIRVPNVPLFLDAWEEAGANPQVIGLDETFTGLQQGMIDGQENPNDLTESNGFYEVQEYVNLTEHVPSWIYVVVGNEQLEALPKDQREQVLEAAEEAENYAQDLMEEQAEEVDERLKEAGVTFNEVDQNAFREAMLPAIQDNLEEEPYELYLQIIEEESREEENK
ncbi:tripartite ATP-independent transporter DctP family solute receptor [Geomicrobium halophilum]|uniref:Tripartite ATP-independent transporter DctP family solute receptor n=1 Tax=Geomicrobium halophilum TaxID=549000 RepID=A0A841PKA5_9BACL|nr:TRAP transporter substrate-binding protein [Geomicrobium halophilum]MBB6448084.1 tripartite ATP-independent transporter DctP family solute receptor [Geomicrobium halophilum]